MKLLGDYMCGDGLIAYFMWADFNISGRTESILFGSYVKISRYAHWNTARCPRAVLTSNGGIMNLKKITTSVLANGVI